MSGEWVRTIVEVVSILLGIAGAGWGVSLSIERRLATLLTQHEFITHEIKGNSMAIDGLRAQLSLHKERIEITLDNIMEKVWKLEVEVKAAIGVEERLRHVMADVEQLKRLHPPL